MFFAPPPPPPVSYGNEVARVLAMRCNSCHGEAGGLSTRSYRDLMAGGSLGKVVIAGEAERSLLVHFIEGRRGEAHRMPQGGQALSAPEVEMIRRWIDEGARDDRAAPPRFTRTLQADLPPGRTLGISCRPPASMYLTLTILDPRTGRRLLQRVATVKSPREEADAGVPGDRLSWEIRPEPGWPVAIAVQLTADFAAADPGDMEFAGQFAEP